VINSRIRFFAAPDDACRYCCASNYEQDQSIANCYTYRVFNTRIYNGADTIAHACAEGDFVAELSYPGDRVRRRKAARGSSYFSARVLS
jgi:hypothetical protein